ncbi:MULTISPECIES: helix-turn-helix domain-containing protein [unclassified Lacticaseibacillus]|uniref:helix-turn-helix domain-containing protein n=1 Tax=unclassified Lacticaseibacillus TaxID=2759744 RepID=UPI002729CA28|nr:MULTISPECIES: helix-turn-helix transcriptional regulator [unclassified Lacticaseibacillus]
MHMARQTVSSWETGRSFPDIQSLLNLSRLYHVSLDTLLKEGSDMVEDLKNQERIVKNARKVYRASLLIDVILTFFLAANLVGWNGVKTTPLGGLLIAVMLLANITVLPAVKKRYFDMSHHQQTGWVKRSLLIIIVLSALLGWQYFAHGLNGDLWMELVVSGLFTPFVIWALWRDEKDRQVK